MPHSEMFRIFRWPSEGTSGLFTSLVVFLLLSLSSDLLFGQLLPEGFQQKRLASGLDPTDITLCKDGRVLISEKKGVIRVIKNGILLTTPFLTLNVNLSNERGLQSLVLDENFESNGYFYLYYTVPATATLGVHNRVSRFTANGDVALLSSEVILVELETLSAGVHNGGAMVISGNQLFIATGDNGVGSNAQSMATLLGKLLRINTDGSIPADNPFYNSLSGKYRSIYALGLRNPFRAALDKNRGQLLINDVGGSKFEEVNIAGPGRNYGWPAIEGMRTTQVAPQNYQDPFYVYNRTMGCAITAVAFYNPASSNFPSAYQNKYFFADYCNGYIKTIDAQKGVAVFASGLNRPIDVEIASNGSLYYLARGGLGGGSVEDNTSSSNGEVWQVTYTGGLTPAISAQPQPLRVTVGASARFIVSATGSNLSYQWQKNGVNIAGATLQSYTLSSVSLSDNGSAFSVKVSNAAGSVTSSAALLTVVDNERPQAQILTPSTSFLYKAGESLYFSGSATNAEGGALPASAFSWRIDFHHDTHTHPAMEVTTGIMSGSFQVPSVGETSSNVWYRIYLTVTDSLGLSHTTIRDVYPLKTTVTLQSVPTGLSLELDGQTVKTPYSFVSVAGIERSLAAYSQNHNGISYSFLSWSIPVSDGVITTPASAVTYTANFKDVLPMRESENPAFVSAGLNYSYYKGAYSVIPDFSALNAVKTGKVNNFDLSPKDATDHYGFRFTGFLQVPADGMYTFYTSSDDGSRLYIGSSLVVDNDGKHSERERSGMIALKAGKHSIRVDYFDYTSLDVLKVSYAGPSLAKQLIPSTVLFVEQATTFQPLVLEAENALRYKVALSTQHSGYSGSGYGDYVNATGDYLEWTASVPQAGNYLLEFRYALVTTTGARPLEIKLNDEVVNPALPFASTSLWTSWKMIPITLFLPAGTSKIRATSTGLSGPNIDYLRISQPVSGRIDFEEGLFAETAIEPQIYPSPADRVINVEGVGENITGFQAWDVLGRPQGMLSFQKSTSGYQVEVSGLPKGMYVLTIHHGLNSITRKIYISR